MTRTIRLLRDTYGGLPYPAGSVLKVEDVEATFATNAGGAIYVDDMTPVTPVPTPPVLQAAAEKAKLAEENRRKLLTPAQRRAEDEARKQFEEDEKQRLADEKEKIEEAKKAQAEAEKAVAAQKAEAEKAAHKK